MVDWISHIPIGFSTESSSAIVLEFADTFAKLFSESRVTTAGAELFEKPVNFEGFAGNDGGCVEVGV